MSNLNELKVAVVGLGYVGLPLALEFGKKYKTYGFDIDTKKVAAYKEGYDPTNECDPQQFKDAQYIEYSTDETVLRNADIIIVGVPTPVDDNFVPDYTPLVSATKALARNLKKGATVSYESTVDPGATEEVCVPLIEQVSGLKWKTDFHVGYSPERINPADKVNTLTSVVKIVSGDTPETLELLAQAYGSVVTAGVFKADSIKAAEAAKVFENTQRDVNIALVNSLAPLCHKMGITVKSVIDGVATKWNALPFRPGFVGGHCIGVDPYYLAQRAAKLGVDASIIERSRATNEFLPVYLGDKIIEVAKSHGKSVEKINFIGVTFKENCQDVRNSKVTLLINKLSEQCSVTVFDKVADPQEVQHEYGINIVTKSQYNPEDVLVIGVGHAYLKNEWNDLHDSMVKPGGIVFDLKAVLNQKEVEKLGYVYWTI